MELILLVAFLVYPAYLLRRLTYRPVKAESRESHKTDDAHYRRTDVAEDRC